MKPAPLPGAPAPFSDLPAPADRCDRCGRPNDNALCPRCERIESEKHTYGWTDCGSYDEMR